MEVSCLLGARGSGVVGDGPGRGRCGLGRQPRPCTHPTLQARNSSNLCSVSPSLLQERRRTGGAVSPAALPRRPLRRQPRLLHPVPRRARQELVMRCACCATLRHAAPPHHTTPTHDDCTIAIPSLRVQVRTPHTPFGALPIICAADTRCPRPSYHRRPPPVGSPLIPPVPRFHRCPPLCTCTHFRLPLPSHKGVHMQHRQHMPQTTGYTHRQGRYQPPFYPSFPFIEPPLVLHRTPLHSILALPRLLRRCTTSYSSPPSLAPL